MSRKFYACQCLFKKGRELVKQNFGKTIYVFTTLKDRNDFVASRKNQDEFYAVTQKEAFAMTNLSKKSTPCVYKHAQYNDMLVLADIKQCYGNTFQNINEIA